MSKMKIDIYKILRIILILMLIGQIVWWAIKGFPDFAWIWVIPELFLIGLWIYVEVKFRCDSVSRDAMTRNKI